MIDLRDDCIESFNPHPVPEWVTRVCADFGVTESGLPKYRVVWNPARVRTMNFPDETTGGRKQRIVRKYPRLGDRWILEVLLPWEMYGKWHEEAFGPKPPDGEYCHVLTFQQTWEGEINVFDHGKERLSQFMSLDDFGQDNLRLMIQCIEKGKAVSAWQITKHDEQLLAIEEEEFHRQFQDVYDNTAADMHEIEKLCEQTGLVTGLDPLPEQIKAQRKEIAKRSGKQVIQ